MATDSNSCYNTMVKQGRGWRSELKNIKVVVAEHAVCFHGAILLMEMLYNAVS